MDDSSLLLFLSFLFGLIFGGVGLALLVWGMVSRRKAQASATWPSTTGSILQAEVRQERSVDDEGSTSITYRPFVQYEYQVGGRTYQSSQLSFGGGVSGTQGWAQKALQPYTPGAPAAVYYNPAKPQEAVLERKAGGFGLLAGLGGLFLLIGVGAFCFGTLALFL